MERGYAMNKKANLLTDLFVWIATVFIFAVSLVIVYYGVNLGKDAIMDNIDTFSNNNVNASQIASYTIEYIEPGLEPLKWISYSVIIATIISFLVGNYLVRANPLWVIPYIFVIMLAVIISVPVSNAYEEIMQDSMLGSTFIQFTGQAYIFLHLPIWVLIIGVIGGILMFINILRDKSTGGLDPYG